MSRLANEFDVHSVLHGQVSLAAVDNIYVFHEALNGYKNLSKDSLMACFVNVDIQLLRQFLLYIPYVPDCHINAFTTVNQ